MPMLTDGGSNLAKIEKTFHHPAGGYGSLVSSTNVLGIEFALRSSMVTNLAMFIASKSLCLAVGIGTTDFGRLRLRPSEKSFGWERARSGVAGSVVASM